MTRARLLIGGEWVPGDGGSLDVTDKFTGAVIGTVDCASQAQVRAAVVAARRSFLDHPLDAQQRYTLLARAGALLEARRDEFAALITAEAGLPITDAANEVVR